MAVMSSNTIKIILIFFTYVFVCGANSLDYKDLQALGVSCTIPDRCRGYKNFLSFLGTRCKCDRACSSYGDCCIDAFRRGNSGHPPLPSNIKCVQYGENRFTGVYAVSNCSSNWRGSREVQERCTGPIDLRDPLSASPVTDTSQGLTYRNVFCAECNNADVGMLLIFQIRITCEGLQDLPEEQILGDITYSNQIDSWGVYRLNSFGNASNFMRCGISYHIPCYLKSSVRSCTPNVISTCAPDWTGHDLRNACGEYMAVVYDEHNNAYRNPHCAICNYRSLFRISCSADAEGRKRPMSFALLLDVNQSDGDQVGMRRVATPQCPHNHKYDPFFKKCRRLVCALPDHVIVDGKCVREFITPSIQK